MTFPIHYTPETLALGDKPRWISATDGDTPTLELPVRMLGMDAPELHYGGASDSNPDKFNDAFASFLTTAGKDLDPGLKAYLQPRLKNKACTRHIESGRLASAHFQQMVAERLKRVSDKSGKELTPRHLFTMVASEVFDRYGRMLAYVNASYTKEERDSLPIKQRQTFNLQMMVDGQATSLIIYPNIPKPSDLELVRKSMLTARTKKRGLWKSGTPLLAFEFRWIIDTFSGKRNGPDRFCGDFTTGKLYPPQRYYAVLPENRLWFYAEDVGDAHLMGFVMAT